MTINDMTPVLHALGACAPPLPKTCAGEFTRFASPSGGWDAPT